ncbi:hypothetical protein WOLCODRAFT_147551 [Wolfiporia cocos MD-104 SS10]|uniref:N-acetyltransferase domain-containing protein n=1 Tax=Wolfiporia cocos (strain MD-104) TaxID=742152 RepID=A0A2H3IVK0_WOLCO|nr:hypothetical protein WOLCODRAFT_147551 [Wolfiporia cocos MD-104 SS10]
MTSSLLHRRPAANYEQIDTSDVKVKPLRLYQLHVSAKTVKNAFKNDPVIEYIFDTPDSNSKRRGWPFSWDLIYLTTVAFFIRHGDAFTIDGGDAVVMLKSAPNAISTVHKVLDSVSKPCIRAKVHILRPLGCTKEQLKRMNERNTKRAKAIKSSLGDRLNELLTVGDLAVAPSKQGRGYGTKLMEYVTATADKQNRGVFLTSSNAANTSFYERHGFRTVTQFVVGDENPSWDRPPVVASVMLREPHSMADSSVREQDPFEDPATS